MKKSSFPWLALGIGLLIGMVLIRSGATDPSGEHGLPLLTMLFMSEFGFVLSAVGAGLGVKAFRDQRGGVSVLAAALACGALATGFFIVGIALWRGAVIG